MATITVEPMHEGYLVKGTDNPEEAEDFLPASPPDLFVKSSGWYRKVPGQWTAWSLYDAEPGSRGAFKGVVFWTEASR